MLTKMKTVIIGGGKGCKRILKLATGPALKGLSLEIICISDPNPNAPGIKLAQKLGFKTCQKIEDALLIPEVELIIEVTGNKEVLKKINNLMSPDTRLMDHVFTRIFWDLLYGRHKQKMQFRKLKTMDRRFLNFINSAHDWITIKNLESRYQLVNKSCAHALNRKPADFIGKTPREIFPKDQASVIISNDKEVIDCNCYREYDEAKSINGTVRQFHTVRFPLTDYKGRVVGICNIGRDVTSEKELQAQLVQSAKLAAVGQLAAGVAHEINNPLTGILAFAEDMMDDVPEDSDMHKDLQVIVRETMRCRNIVRNLLDFSRQEQLNLESVSPNLIVDQTISLVKKLPQFLNIVIKKRLSDNMPFIKCDIRQLQQVVLNLMINASDAMKGNGVIILGTEYDNNRGKCVIFVEDNGPGIPENMVDKIFEPFFSSKGTNGLGLAVSWGIVERHRGIIEVDMAESGGAIFRIVLPENVEVRE
jgi:PAS domain S-box-containing protein